MYWEKLREEVLYGGHANLGAYLMTLRVMDEENMKDWEKRLLAEVNELKMIEADVKALRIKLDEKSNEIRIPEWIMDPLLREEVY